ncbi:MAG: alanine racemase, partial [Niabella sp.]|nr:alanine racemase [Niabella sp.]
PKIKRFIELIKACPQTDFSCVIDNETTAVEIDEAANAAGIRIPVYVDINVGMNRTGILPEQAATLYTSITRLNHLSVRGLHAYDGHIHDAPFEIRKEQSDAAFAVVDALKNRLIDQGMTEPVIIIGGSPTFPIHAKRAKVECSPGTFVYWDYGYGSKFTEQQFLPAALVVSRVISLPDATTVCADLGHKSIAAENPLPNRVHFINAPAVVFEGQSEEHLKLNAGKGHSFKIGDVLYGMPVHICPTVALYEKAVLVENGIAGKEWKTIARDKKITI